MLPTFHHRNEVKAHKEHIRTIVKYFGQHYIRDKTPQHFESLRIGFELGISFLKCILIRIKQSQWQCAHQVHLGFLDLLQYFVNKIRALILAIFYKNKSFK